MRIRKFGILTLTGLLVGSIFFITYPSTTGGIFYGKVDLSEIKNDQTLRKYTDLESTLVNQRGSAENPSETNTTTSGNTLLVNLALQKDYVEKGLLETKLSDSQISTLSRLATDRSQFERSTCGSQETVEPPMCEYRSSELNAKTVVLLGDSKMGVFAQPIIDYYTQRDWNVFPYIMFGCRPSATSSSDIGACRERTNWILKKLDSEKVDLAIISEYPADPEPNSKFLKLVESKASKVVIIQQVPKTRTPVDCISKDYTFTSACSRINENEEAAWKNYILRTDAMVSTKIKIVKAYDWFCSSVFCPISINSLYSTRDGSHLTYSFVKSLTPIIESTLESL